MSALATLAFYAIAKDYKLDIDRAWSLEDGSNDLPIPTRVAVYLDGPALGMVHYPFSILPRAESDYSTTNKTEITNLMSILRYTNSSEGITNIGSRVGYTYNILFFQATDKTVIHYYVFDPNIKSNEWLLVLPRSGTGSCWFNKGIGPWLHQRVKIPSVDDRSNNTIGTNSVEQH